MAYSYSDSTNRLYDLSGNELGSFEGEFRGFSDDGQRLVAYSNNSKISQFYDWSGNPERAEFGGNFSEFHPDQDRLVTTVFDEDISRIYDRAGILLAEYPGSVFGNKSSLGFTPDGNHLLTLTNDGYLHLWQLDDGLDDLLTRGCNYVRPYLLANPDVRPDHPCRANYF